MRSVARIRCFWRAGVGGRSLIRSVAVLGFYFVVGGREALAFLSFDRVFGSRVRRGGRG